VKRLSAVFFNDSSFDSKGAAFEYYVKATLKGKKLGQYFTPRAVIHLMTVLVGREKIANATLMGKPLRVLDPACGTGGFLVYLMRQGLAHIQHIAKQNKISHSQAKDCIKLLRENVFFGADANQSVASAAKMNMIIAGDGHSNILFEDSLSLKSQSWTTHAPFCDIIITNPPFGTSEGDTLSPQDLVQFPVPTVKGQLLFLQKMVQAVQPISGEICTVIDEGVLNTDAAASLRSWILQHCVVRAIVHLPDVTFKPNKINVRSSIVYLVRREFPDVDFEASYDVTFIDLKSLGYQGSGDPIRGFDEPTLMMEIESFLSRSSHAKSHTAANWVAFNVPISEIYADEARRLDLKYWSPETLDAIKKLASENAPSLRSLATVDLRRGRSPPPENYVDEQYGYGHVIKSGTKGLS